MKMLPTKLDRVFIFQPKVFDDERGLFVKIFHQDFFAKHGIRFEFQESYYSTSTKDVIRGMHFQSPPMDHYKLVYVTYGAILDVVLDIRKGSPTYGQYITVELSDKDRSVVVIPPGFAHGFMSRQDNSHVTYIQSTMHSPDHDNGVRHDSFGFDWGVANPIMSKRDQEFPTLGELETPFTYDGKAA